MFIDFERSTLQSQRRVPLRIISSNQKRKREVGSAEKGPTKRLSCFVREKRRIDQRAIIHVNLTDPTNWK
jgi:hypothetical protein